MCSDEIANIQCINAYSGGNILKSFLSFIAESADVDHVLGDFFWNNNNNTCDCGLNWYSECETKWLENKGQVRETNFSAY